MAAAAVPIGASMLAPSLATAAAPVLAGTMLEGAAPWLTGAALGGLGGFLTGQNPLQGALLGGLGGGLSAKFMPNGLGGLFDGGDAAAGALDAVNPTDMAQDAFDMTGAMPDIVNQGTSDAASSGLWGNVGKFAPYAAVSGGATLLDSMGKPKQVGPTPQSHPSNSGQVAPLTRTAQNVDPNSYYAPSTADARSYFGNYSMQPQFMANGGSASASSSNIPLRGYYANGGLAGSGMIKGKGDGRSDSIPAQLSDGEFVVSAPVVSALGNGSNDAGAKKLGAMQKQVLQKHYKGGKPHKAMGLGSYVH